MKKTRKIFTSLFLQQSVGQYVPEPVIVALNQLEEAFLTYKDNKPKEVYLILAGLDYLFMNQSSILDWVIYNNF